MPACLPACLPALLFRPPVAHPSACLSQPPRQSPALRDLRSSHASPKMSGSSESRYTSEAAGSRMVAYIPRLPCGSVARNTLAALSRESSALDRGLQERLPARHSLAAFEMFSVGYRTASFRESRESREINNIPKLRNLGVMTTRSSHRSTDQLILGLESCCREHTGLPLSTDLFGSRDVAVNHL